MRNNQRRVVYDLHNATTSGVQFAEENGGLYLENMNDDNTTHGGGGFPMRFLRWDNLDTLELSLNYLEGSLPTDAQVRAYLSCPDWSSDDAPISFVQNGETLMLEIADSIVRKDASDQIKQAAYDAFDALQVPKVLPKLRVFSLNYNRLSGSLSPGLDDNGRPLDNPTGDTYRWLMFHPLMDWWEPSTFIFNQEGTDSEGNSARFTDVPLDMDYYYGIYTNKEFAD